MRRRVLIDTNIVLDAAMGERSEHAPALFLLDEAVYGELDVLIAGTSLKDAYYILSKYADEPSARKFVCSLLEIAKPVAVDSACLYTAAHSDEPDFEDGIIRACAEKERADFIISRDEKAFRTCSTRKVSALEYLELFSDAQSVQLDDA